jgi:hypothetical protein
MTLLETETFFNLKFKKPQSIADFIRLENKYSFGVLDEIRSHIRGTSYELGTLIAKEAARIRTINDNRRFAATHASEVWTKEVMSNDFIQEINEFSKVLTL